MIEGVLSMEHLSELVRLQQMQIARLQEKKGALTTENRALKISLSKALIQLEEAKR